MKRWLSCLLCLALLLSVVPGCKGRAQVKVAKMPDTALVDNIRGRIADEGLPQVRVFALDGRVTLSGTVPSKDVKERMIALAKGTPGVSRVSDDLRIGKTP